MRSDTVMLKRWIPLLLLILPFVVSIVLPLIAASR